MLQKSLTTTITTDRAGKRNRCPGVCGRIPILLPGELSALHPGAFKTQEKGKPGRGRTACRVFHLRAYSGTVHILYPDGKCAAAFAGSDPVPDGAGMEKLPGRDCTV